MNKIDTCSQCGKPLASKTIISDGEMFCSWICKDSYAVDKSIDEKSQNTTADEVENG